MSVAPFTSQTVLGDGIGAADGLVVGISVEGVLVGISDGNKVDGAGVDVSRGRVALGVIVATAVATGTLTVDMEYGSAAVAVGVDIRVLTTNDEGNSAVTVGVVARTPFVVSLGAVRPVVAPPADLVPEIIEVDDIPALGIGVASPAATPGVEAPECVRRQALA